MSKRHDGEEKADPARTEVDLGVPEMADTAHDARPIDARMAQVRPSIPTQIAGRYEVGALLGEGGMGEVRECRDVVLERSVALKTIRRDRYVQQLEARFVREACVQAQLDHPSIVPVYEVSRDETGSAYFTMRKVDGIALDEVIHGMRVGDAAITESFTRHRLLTAFSQVCLALDYAHSRGVLHRDLKPANVMFGDFGEVYLLDWGVAKVTLDDASAGPLSAVGTPAPVRGGDRTLVGATLGTPAYMAPEQLAGREIDARADVFSLGAVLFEILTLEPLFDEASVTARSGRNDVTWDARPSARAAGHESPPELDRICVRATAGAIEKRYGSARELHDALEAYLGGERDLELRQRSAAAHLARAEAARNVEPDTALREVNRMLALAPDDPRGLELLVTLLENTAAAAEKAKKDVVSESIARLRRTQPLGAVLLAAPWVTAYPAFALARGVWNPWLAVVPPIAWVLSAIAILIDNRQGTQERVIYPTVVIMTAVAATSLLFGPLFVMPALAVTVIGNHVLVSARQHRAISIILACAAVVIPTAAAWLGIHDVYHFESETTFTVAGMFKVIRSENISAMLTLTDIVMLFSAAVFAMTFRDEIERGRTSNVLFAWTLSKLLPAAVSEAPVVAPPATSSSDTVDRILDTEIDLSSGQAAGEQTKLTTMPEGDEVGTQLPLLVVEGPRYVTRARLALTPSASVDQCRDQLIGRNVAMKRPRPELRARADDALGFTHEAQLLARLDHPGVPPVYDLGRDDDGPWLTTKLVRGRSLAEVLAREPNDEPARRRRLTAFAKVCLTLDFAHANRTVHGALDPTNIVLGEFGEVYVLGWSEATGAAPDTGVSYVAPEQAAGDRGDPRADVFTLGVILYELIAGKPLFAGDARLSLALGNYDARPSAVAGSEHVPPELDAICAKATAHDPADRHASAREIHDAIQALLSRDRDEELRRELAEKRFAAATKSTERALATHDEAARIEALRELGRALALAADRAPGFALLERLLRSPPTPLPLSVTHEAAAQSWAMARRAAKATASTYALAWLVVFPSIAVLLGVRDVLATIAIALAWAVAAGTAYVQHAFIHEPPRAPWASFTGLLAVSVTSLLLGPHILVPALTIAMTMGYLLGGRLAWRRTIVVLGALAIAIPGLLAWAGAMSAFDVIASRERPTIVLQGALHHPPDTLLVWLMLANVAAVLVAAAYAARFRDTLEEIQAESRAKVLALSRLLS